MGGREMTTNKDQSNEHWAPTQSGQFPAYQAEYLEIDGKWKPIPTHNVNTGVPYPLGGGGILNTIGLMGYSQARAIAWKFTADHEAIGTVVDTRIVVYELHYDIKAKRIEDGAIMSKEEK
jgi:hypothetical protein